MPDKTLIQKPVSMDHVKQVVFIILATGIDAVTNYQPIDDSGATIGEVRSFTENFRGPDDARIRQFLATELLSDINLHEGT